MSENFLPPKTTFEMDGMFAQEDINNRFFVMALCAKCPEWSKMCTLDYKFECKCGSDKYDLRETRSIRTWSPELKRKPKTRKA